MSFCSSRYSRISAGTSCPMAASCSSTSASVEGPVLVFLSTGSCSLLEQQRGQLLRGVEVERRCRPPARSAPRARPGRGSARATAGRRRPVDRDARPTPCPPAPGPAAARCRAAAARAPSPASDGAKNSCERQHRRAVGAAVGRRGRHRHLGEGDLRTCPSPVRSVYSRMPPAEMLEAQRVDGVGAAPGIEHEAGEHRVVGHARQLDPGPPQHLPVVLDVVPRLGHRGIAQQRGEGAQAGSRRAAGGSGPAPGAASSPAGGRWPKGRYQTSVRRSRRARARSARRRAARASWSRCRAPPAAPAGAGPTSAGSARRIVDDRAPAVPSSRRRTRHASIGGAGLRAASAGAGSAAPAVLTRV